MFMLAFATACALVAHSPHYRRKPPHPAAAVSASLGPSVMQERALRRRVVRLARIKMLERRQAMLFAFLAKTHTQTPLFEDPSIVAVGAGILIGPTTITLDFLGSPIVRARVHNASAARASPLLTVRMRSEDGQDMRVSTVLEPLEPGASRTIELLSPWRGRPVSITWSAMP